MIAMTFDLSSTCIGVTFAQVENKQIVYGKTLPIIPKKPDARDLGYTTKTPKTISSSGNTYKTYLKPGEMFVSKAEAERRRSTFKNLEHNYLLRNIGQQCGMFLNKIKPDVLAIERNKSFNGILTTKLLAEIAGGMYFYSGAHGITLYDWDEATIRAKIRKDILSFSLQKNEEEEKIAVDTKWEIYCRLREYFSTKHNQPFDFSNMTLDESDSLAVFYYLYTTILLKGEKV